jgi:hypothetical protein
MSSCRAPRTVLPATVNETLHAAASNRRTEGHMQKWRQFPSIVAKRRNAKPRDRYYTDYLQRLQSWASSHPYGIRAHYWAITYARRDLPRMDIIILWHRRATVAVTASITAALTALEAAFKDSATLLCSGVTAVTTKSKAFRSIVAHRTLER